MFNRKEYFKMVKYCTEDTVSVWQKRITLSDLLCIICTVNSNILYPEKTQYVFSAANVSVPSVK